MGRSTKWLAWTLIAIIAGMGALYWWHAGGSEALLQLLRPGFQVVGIDLGAQTITLRQTNRTYTVRCEDACKQFVIGQSYPAVDRGSDLEIRLGRRQVRCAIIKIEVRFDVHPGGVGALYDRGAGKNTTGAYRIRCGVRMATARALLS